MKKIISIILALLLTGVLSAEALEYFRGTAEEINQIVRKNSDILGYEAIDGNKVNTGGYFRENLLPLLNNTYDVGSSALKFKNGEFAGTVTANSFVGDGSGLTGVATASSTSQSLWNALFVGRTATTTIYGDTTTSSFSSGISGTALNITSTSATSTFANGIQLARGCFLLADGTCAGAGGANTALSNLAAVAINTSLLSDTNNTDDLGSYALSWKNLYVSGTIYGNLSTSTLDNVVIGGSTRAAGNFTTLSANGVFTPSGGISTSTIDNIVIGGSTRAAGNFTALDFNGAGVLGDGGDDIAINSNDWDISSAGVATNFSISTTTLDNVVIGGSTSAVSNFTRTSSSLASVFSNLYIGGTATTVLRQQGSIGDNLGVGVSGRTFIGVSASGDTQLGGGSGSIYTTFFVNNVERARLVATGFSIGSDTPTSTLTVFNSSAPWVTIGTGTASTTLTSIATSTFANGLNILGNIAKNGSNLTTTSTINLVFDYNPATGTNSNLLDFRLPYSCTVQEVVIFATSTPATGQPTVIDVNTINSTHTSTSSILSANWQTQLNASSFASTTLAANIGTPVLAKGTYLNADIDQYGGHKGLQVQVSCAKSLW